jgi:uncharacterized protein (DUF934 family)
MALIKHEKLVEDEWSAATGALSDGRPVIVDLDTWRQRSEELRRRNVPLGVRLSGDQSPELLADDLPGLSLVALEFAKFTDGRAYSHARLLRERYGFEGEVRAVGEVLRDQLQFMLRCGFDAFEVPSDRVAEDWLDVFSEITIAYQPAVDAQPSLPAWRRQHASRRASAEAYDEGVCAAYWAY